MSAFKEDILQFQTLDLVACQKALDKQTAQTQIRLLFNSVFSVCQCLH